MGSPEKFDPNDALDGGPGYDHEKSERVVEIQYKNAVIRLISSEHNRENTYEEIGRPDLIAIETGDIPAQAYLDSRMWIQVMEAVKADPQYSLLECMAEGQEIPIYGIDLPLPQEFDVLDEAEENSELGKAAGAFVIAIALSLVQEKCMDEKAIMTRRAFLIGAAAATAVTGYFMSDQVLKVAAMLGPAKTEVGLLDIARRVIDLKGLKQFKLKLRDLVMAHKLTAIAERRLHDRRPVGDLLRISVPVGGNHVRGLRQALAMESKEREAFIREIIETARKITPSYVENIEELLTNVPVAVKKQGKEWEGTIMKASLSGFSREVPR